MKFAVIVFVGIIDGDMPLIFEGLILTGERLLRRRDEGANGLIDIIAGMLLYSVDDKALMLLTRSVLSLM